MAITVTIRDESAPGREQASFELPGIPETITVREFIRTRVREEVANYNSRPTEAFNGLVQPVDAERTLNGYRLERPRTLDWEEQARVAEEAFARNGFFVIVDDRQVEDLDEELRLTPETEVRFLRLTPLVGG
jgi:hypothetical protein